MCGYLNDECFPSGFDLACSISIQKTGTLADSLSYLWIGVQANMLKWYPQIILGRFSFHLSNLPIAPNYLKITQMQENVLSYFSFFGLSISYFGWLYKSGKMEWSVCRYEERDVEFNFSSVSKRVWICHVLFLAKHFFSLKKF